MLELYNNVASILQKKYPQGDAKIGFLAYANMTLPPVRPMQAERSLFCELAPIDIDPIHGMDHPPSPPRREYRDMLYKWAKVMQGRLCIYDYDQGMLVWRDIPNPSHMAFRRDVQHYRKAGVMGVNTESRNAIATTFLNLYLRARLLWNPDEDVDGLLDEFYPKFYGPAAEPMKTYWSTIYDADLRLAYVTCNGQERGNRRRHQGERNGMWDRLERQHATNPLHLLLHGSDQLYADEMLEVHPALREWSQRQRADFPDAPATDEAGELLRDYLLTSYLDSFQQKMR